MKEFCLLFVYRCFKQGIKDTELRVPFQVKECRCVTQSSDPALVTLEMGSSIISKEFWTQTAALCASGSDGGCIM